MSMRALFGCCLLILSATSLGAAEVKGPKGEKCDSVKSGDEHKIKDVNYTCDKCVFLQCDASGKQIDKCASVSYWTNCVEKTAPKSGTSAAKPTDTKTTKP